jgi:hypothetical protein
MAQQAQETGPQPQVVEMAVNSDCYTVDLFTKAKVQKPANNVPEAHRQFLGEWGGGAWNDFWCHDLVVTNIHPDGRVDLIEMLAPHEPWNYPATAFQRVGRIDDNGNLRFAYGTERLSYRIENGRLYGARSGRYGNLQVELKRRGVPPIPAPNPLRMTRLAEAAQTGS